jgi:hypothetical protein
MSVVFAGWAPADSGIITAAMEKTPANRGAINRISVSFGFCMAPVRS